MITFIIFLVGLFVYLNLRNRIDRLEKLVGIQNRSVPQAPSSQMSQTDIEELKKLYGSNSNTITQKVAVPAPSIDVGPTAIDKFGAWLKEDWLLKFGVLLLLFGFGWFATYAFAHNWIGPMGRITLGIVVGAIFLLIGNWRIKNFLHQGGAFLVLGSTTILLTVFAAREVYNFFTPFSALALMFLSTAFVAFVSVKVRNKALSLASLALAGVAPLLTNSPTTDHMSLFAYLFVVILGAIWVTVITGRRELITASLILVTFYSLPHLMWFSSADKGVLLLFAYAFSSVFFLVNIFALLKLKDSEVTADIVTAAGNGLFLLAWILSAAQDEWKSIILSAWVVVFGVGAYLIYLLNNRKESFYTYAGVGVVFIAAATGAELKGATLTIAYAIESGLLSLIVYKVTKDLKIANTLGLLLIGPMILSLRSFVSLAWNTGFLNKDFFVLLIVGAVTALVGEFLRRKYKETGKETSDVAVSFIVVASLYAYALVWKVSHSLILDNDVAVMISLVIYTVVGITTYFYGKLGDKGSFKVYGGVLLGSVIARLFLVDVWKMELGGKIATFFLLGALLVSTAFISKNKKDSSTVNNV